MQTFLPFADFVASARVLDTRRLGKQRVEALQVLRAITRPDYGWRHHPVPKMWRGFEEALGAYALAICGEWCARGHADTCAFKIRAELTELGVSTIRSQAKLAAAGRLPPWLGDERLHRSHRSALVRKDPQHYGPLLPDADPELEYYWPSRADT